MPVPTPSVAAQAVASKYEDIANKYNDHQDDIDKLQKLALQEVLPSVLTEVGLEDDSQAIKHVRQFLKDRGTVFRFFRRNRYSTSNALDMLTSTLTWRLRTDLDSLSLSSLHPLYASPPNRPPLFWCNTNSYDLYGRPLGVISLQSLERVTNDDGQQPGLDECREYIVGCMESVRRYLAVQYSESVDRTGSRKIDLEKVREIRQQQDEISLEKDSTLRPPPLQMVIIFSLQSSGMANLEMELLPFLLDLLKNHFPGMVGAVYILHFGWIHSGMWALAKRVLPQQALAKIFFPSGKELSEHFDLQKLPIALGGEQEVEMNEGSNDVMKKYARTHWNTRSSRSGSRSELNKKIQEKRLNENENEEEKEDEEDKNDLDDLETLSAPPSPKHHSGISTPALHPVTSRTPRTLSRVGSFDSLMDEFHSLGNSPQLSRSATPRQSRPTTPHTELSGYHFTLAFPSKDGDSGSAGSTSTLRLPASSVKKLHNLQMTRGDLLRSRTISDATALHDLSGEGSGMINRSPIISRGVSPERHRHQRRRTLTNQTAGSSSTRGRNVHFESKGDEPSQNGGEIEFTQRGVPIRRIGSLRDFRLWENDLARADDGIVDSTDGSNANSDEESDKSGKKIGHKGEEKDHRKSSQDGRAKRFFSLWRRGTPPQQQGGQIKSDIQSSTSMASIATKSEGTTNLGDDEDGDLTLLPPEPVSPGSPQLQVPDIEEPPLSEMTRTFSRRSRLYGSLPGHVSPYNKANPFYGYPAYPVNQANGGTGDTVMAVNDPRKRYQFRRRKRDLVRTLIYLFVLRLLALHRHVRSALLSSYRFTLRTITIGGVGSRQITDDDGRDDPNSTSSQNKIQQQYKRYEVLRNSSKRFIENERRQQQKQRRGSSESLQTMQQQQPQKPKPQPLVALGFRKRYAILMIIIAFTLLRNEWRSRRR